MKYPDAHNGAILTPKTKGLDANQAMYGTNEDVAKHFHEIAADGNLIFEILDFAQEFFIERGELFTTHEELWLYPKDLDEFSLLYIAHKNRHAGDTTKDIQEFVKLGEFIEIAKKNQQPIIFVT